MLKEDIKNRIIESLKPYNPEKIILFGSFAYGKPVDGSDIDLLIIKDLNENEVRPYRVMLKKELVKNFKGSSIYFDVLVDSEQRINNRIEIGDLFYGEIYNKGQVIYA